VGVDPYPYAPLLGKEAAAAPGMLWIFREPGYSDLYITFWDDHEPRRQLDVSERAIYDRFKIAFPEANIIVRRGQSLESIPVN
jgi:hypothetical protein